MYSDGLYSYYEYVKGRVNAYTTRVIPNLTGVVKGLMNAQDWPPKNVVEDAFYLIVGADTSIGKQGYSASTPIKFHMYTWAWINKGTDVTPTVRQPNRGDRLNTMQVMKGELVNGHYPGFCEKFTWGYNNGGVWTPSPEPVVEYITWKPIEFNEKWSQAGGAGVGYGQGTTRVADMLDTITA